MLSFYPESVKQNIVTMQHQDHKLDNEMCHISKIGLYSTCQDEIRPNILMEGHGFTRITPPSNFTLEDIVNTRETLDLKE